MADRFPRPYTNSVPKENGEPVMQYVDFDRLGIGARTSGMPGGDMNQIKSLDHVGKSASNDGGKRKWGGK
jgi:hypothetical protein